MKKALVCGAGGFIGSHLVKYLKAKGYFVCGIDLKMPMFSITEADEFIIGDLADINVVRNIFKTRFDEVYQLAADMGGAGYLFTSENDADVMHNSALINLNVLRGSVDSGVNLVFFSSSACVYPEYNQLEPDSPVCKEDSVYPAQPDSEYGWEKLFSERLYFSFMRNYDITVKVARFHNIFGPEGTYFGGKEKVPAALARKVAEAANEGEIEVWGDGLQTRSFLYVDDCLEAVFRLVQSDFNGPVNIGSDKLISINELAGKFIHFSKKTLTLKHIEGPQGVRGRNSDNKLIFEQLGWEPQVSLDDGLKRTYDWVATQVREGAEV